MNSRIALLLGLTAVPALAADRWWDGGTTNIGTAGDAASAGGAGTWNTTLQNWDQGSGLAHAAWDNAKGDTAIFGGATAGTVTLGTAITANGLAILNSSGTYTISGSAITLTGSSPLITVTRNGTISSKLSGSLTNGLTKNGSATLTLNGSVANDFTGGLKIQVGTVTLSFANMATPTDLIPSSNAVSLGSGVFGVTAKSSGISSQSVNGLVLNGGSSAAVAFTSTFSASSTLNLGGITRNANAVVNFTLPAAGSIMTTATNNAKGILGTWACTVSGTSLNYAAVGSGFIGALSGTAAADGSALTDTFGNANYDLAASGGSVPASVSANTIRYTGTAGTTAPGATLFSANGLMNAGSGLWTIGSNDITIGAERELVIHTGTNGITMSGVIKENSASALTITGTGALTLNTANTYSGATTLHGTSAYGDNGSTLTISSPLKHEDTVSEFGKGSSILLHGAVIQSTANNTSGTCDRDFTISGTSGFYLKNVLTQTLSGSISGSGNLSMDSDFASTTSPGKANLVLAGENSFTGDVILQNDSRITLAHANALANATLNLSGTRIMADLATHNLAYAIGGLKGSVNLNLGSASASGGNGMVSIGSNHQSTTYTGVLSGAAGLIKAGTGTLALSPATPNSYGGDTRVDAGVLAVNGSALPDSTKLVLNGGKIAASGIETVDTLHFGTVQQASGTWGATGSGADHTDDTRFTGTAGVVKVQPWSVNGNQLNFGQVTNGDTIQMTVTITNLGTSTIQGSAAVTGPRYAVTGGANWSVAANSTTAITVAFSPIQNGSAPDTLTLTGAGLTRTIALSGEGVTFSQPVATQFQDYEFKELPSMAAPAAQASITLNEGSSLTQSFKPRRDAFLTEFAARDTAAPLTCTVQKLTVKTSAYQSSPSTLRFEILRIEANGDRTALATQDLNQQLFGTTAYSVTFAEPAVLDFDTSYEVRMTLVTCGARTYGGGPSIQLFAPANGYADGALASGGDLWFESRGSASIPVFPQLVVTADAANRFFYDGDTANADSSSHDKLKGKLLGLTGPAEKLVFTHPAAWGPLFFSVENTSHATAAAGTRSGTADTFQLSGVAEGDTMLWVKSGTSVVAYIKLMSFPQRPVPLSYTYVQYPGESNHALKGASAEIMAYISAVYAKANVAIQWTDNGVITHEWDANGDGNSFAEDYSEVWSPIDDAVLPNMNAYFSNVFMLRYNKDDNYLGGSNGGGTSMGYGPGDPPRGANVRCHLLRPASQFASTLAHEVGHNLGLGHTNITNNMMDVGRAEDGLWGWQWTIIHNTLKTLPPPPVIQPDGNGNGIIDTWEVFMFGSSAAGANPADADPDGDGLDNLLEFAFGTHPLQANANPLAGSMAAIGDERYLRISVARNPAATNLTFGAELSGELGGWSSMGVDVEENTPTRFTARDTIPAGSAPSRFIRLKVSTTP